MTNNQKALTAGRLLAIANEEGTSNVDRLALTAAAYELVGKQVQAAKFCPPEVEMEEAGYAVPDKEWMQSDDGQNVRGTANTNAGKYRIPSREE